MDPKRDPRFQEAWRENRILSVRQETGGKKDSGEVGYVSEPGVAYFIFPKSLEPFAGRKIIGIQYDLVAPGKPHGRAVTRGQRPKARPAAKRYEVTLRVMAVVHVTQTVEAASMREAEEAAMKDAQTREINFANAKLIRRVMKARQV
jgi:hypothetical protein